MRIYFSRGIPKLLLTVLLFYVALSSCGQRPEKILAVDGILDLRSEQVDLNSFVKLEGEWEFYWKQLYLSKDFANKISPKQKTPQLIKFPGAWNGKFIEGKKITGDGFATYRLQILLKEEAPSLAFQMPTMHSAYTLYANGEKIYSNGTVGTTASQSKPQYLPGTAYIKNAKKKIELILHISNFHHRKGGGMDKHTIGKRSFDP